MPVRSLPTSPSLDHLKNQAKDLLKGHAAREAEAAQRLREFHPRFGRSEDRAIFDSPLKVSDAQLAIAREYGFPSWGRLKQHVEMPALAAGLKRPHHERIEDANLRRAVDLLDAGDVTGLQALLKHHPGLVRQRAEFEGGNYFRHPSLLEFAAENPIRRGRLPENIVAVVKAILEAGPEPAARDETLMLVATGSVPRQCGVQRALIDVLCDYGADANSAARAAALLGEMDAAGALLQRGAVLDLPLAAALGRVEEARRLLPASSAEDRHLALTMAADHGHAGMVRLLLDAGEDPNRYNPVGGHSHTTPLHQAALGGHEDVVRLLVERGARLDMKDILWRSTPEGWARHNGHTALAEYLREKMEKKK